MRNTGSIYNTVLGSFSSADGDLRLVNVSAGGGKSYMAWQKVPEQLKEFTDWLNRSMSMLAAGNHGQDRIQQADRDKNDKSTER